MSEFNDHAGAGRPRVLLVDDAELNRDIIGRVLEANDFDVDVVASGEEACEMTWSKSYDLVLMDIEMPGMTGFEAAARIRAREGVMSGVKIAALTATAQPDAEEVSFWSGIDTFIAKPIEPKNLVAKVRELVAAAAPGGNDWKPVWRLRAFEHAVQRPGAETAEAYLHSFTALLETATWAIDTRRSLTGEFARTVLDLLKLSTLLGFDEIAGLCALHRATQGQLDMRCRDPNLLGAIDRARYAISVYQKERNMTPLADWWGRARVNVQSLFRGKAMMPTLSADIV